MKKHFPNAITCLNLLTGMVGIYLVTNGQLTWAIYVVVLAGLFDFLDGLVARILSVHSEIGKQLDSLADMVTFGVLPSFVVFIMLKEVSNSSYTPFVGFLIGIKSALRLAKFNVDTRQSDRFIGLPTPANALFLCALPHLSASIPWAKNFIYSPSGLIFITLLFSFLLTAELPLIALKFKTFSIKENLFRFLLIAFSLIGVLLLGFGGLSLVILFYILLSLLENWLNPSESLG